MLEFTSQDVLCIVWPKTIQADTNHISELSCPTHFLNKLQRCIHIYSVFCVACMQTQGMSVTLYKYQSQHILCRCSVVRVSLTCWNLSLLTFQKLVTASEVWMLFLCTCMLCTCSTCSTANVHNVHLYAVFCSIACLLHAPSCEFGLYIYTRGLATTTYMYMCTCTPRYQS